MSRANANNSTSQLQIELRGNGSKECLACIQGPGSQCKRYWVRQPKPDTMTVMSDTDDRMWMQVIIASGMVAAKAQRHKAKVMAVPRKTQLA